MTGTFPQGWEETALVSIDLFPGTVLTFQAHAMTETVDISEPDYPGESIMNVAGGRIWKQSGQEDGEITLELYPVRLDIEDAGTDIFGGLFQFFASNQTIDISAPSQPISTSVSKVAGVDYTRDRFRVAIMWTDDTNVSSAAAATSGSNKVGLRFVAMGCRMTSHKSDFTDGVLKVTATFKFPAMNKAGTVKMFRWDSTNAGSANPMTALPTYDDDDKWTT